MRILVQQVPHDNQLQRTADRILNCFQTPAVRCNFFLGAAGLEKRWGVRCHSVICVDQVTVPAFALFITSIPSGYWLTRCYPAADFALLFGSHSHGGGLLSCALTWWGRGA
jgi:hypothetical protein